MKKLYVAIVALFATVALFAQPGGFGGGFGGPMGGGMGMGPGMGGPGMGSFDPFSMFRADIADRKTEELTQLLGLTPKQAKKVNIIYNHSDSGIMEEMQKAMDEMQKEMEANMPKDAEGKGKGRGNGQRPEGGPGMGGFGGPMGGGMGMGMGRGGFGGGDFEAPENIPVSAKEKAYREKQMQKVLTPEQFGAWMKYESEQPAVDFKTMFKRPEPKELPVVQPEVK